MDVNLNCGMVDSHIDYHALEKPVHKQLVAPFKALQRQAKKAGFDLRIASGFRGFQRQLDIWNAKACGRRAVLDSAGQELNTADLSTTQLMFAILRWSALPGASRHHWGSDVDIYDANRISLEELQLVPEEYQGGGPCAELVDWLKTEAAAEAFCWPYLHDTGGVAPEPWHLSYWPVAQQFQQRQSVDSLAAVIAAADIRLQKEILLNLDNIFVRYIKHVSDI